MHSYLPPFAITHIKPYFLIQWCKIIKIEVVQPIVAFLWRELLLYSKLFSLVRVHEKCVCVWRIYENNNGALKKRINFWCTIKLFINPTIFLLSPIKISLLLTLLHLFILVFPLLLCFSSVLLPKVVALLSSWKVK